MVGRGSHILNRQSTQFVVANAQRPGAPSNKQDHNMDEVYNDMHFNTTTFHIEKSQWMGYGNFEQQGPAIQPSLHIGIQPVPALTTASLQGQSNSSFTDSSAYFEIIAEMVVETSYPTPYPLASSIHTTEHGAIS